jgi:hypothetical protein
MIARFKGGPLGGEERQIEDGLKSMLAHDPIEGRPNRVIEYRLAGADVGQEGVVFLFVPNREIEDMVSPAKVGSTRHFLIA